MNDRLTIPATNNRRRYNFTPTLLLLFVIAAEVWLLLSDRFDWLDFNERKGWSVLICLAAVAALAIVLATYVAVSVWMRRRPQFSLGALLVLMAACAIPCAWMAAALRGAQLQRQRVEACYKVGGSPFYDDQLTAPGQPQFRSGPVTTPWLYKHLGKDFFHDVAGLMPRTDEQLLALRGQTSLHTVMAHYSDVTDAGLEVVATFPKLRWLDLRDAPGITDAGLAHVRDLAELERLMLRRTDVTDAAMAFLRNKPRLQMLDLGMTNVTGAGLQHLAQSTDLRSLKFWGNDIDDDALAVLRPMTHMEDLDLGFADVTDDGLEHLAHMKDLQALGLRGSHVTDRGMPHIARFTALRRLDLFKTAISDASINHLLELQQLETLYIGETQLTQDGIARLREALPECDIKSD